MYLFIVFMLRMEPLTRMNPQKNLSVFKVTDRPVFSSNSSDFMYSDREISEEEAFKIKPLEDYYNTSSEFEEISFDQQHNLLSLKNVNDNCLESVSLIPRKNVSTDFVYEESNTKSFNFFNQLGIRPNPDIRMYHCILMKKIKKFIKKVTLKTKINAAIKLVKVNLSLFKNETFKFCAPLIREVERFVLNHKSLKISHKYKKIGKEIEVEKKLLDQKGPLIFIK
ncbi:hypothetical protein TUBRATIS_003230 [Tubulinosema ratisbonensis]|uniref:Uncharacterized protein n=1 Tax=Tubulinosema ratisbonensis TaxID=291195 RepID=A0A437APN0_9MICR|nr:hypothetical protein TUBRATIS_003230 [Tubulinosema ratisbonensis]